LPGITAKDLAGLLPAEPADARAGIIAEVVEESAPARLPFVGDYEAPARYDSDIDSQLSAFCGGAVSVTWLQSGFSSKWGADAERAEATYRSVDVPVMMRYVRTMLW
jgi:hypothetical protein